MSRRAFGLTGLVGSSIQLEHLDRAPVQTRIREDADATLRLSTPDWMNAARCAARTLSCAQLVIECHLCPVAEDCLEYAVEHSIGFDVWGGLTPTQRDRMFPEVGRNHSLKNGSVYVVRMGDYIKAGFTTTPLAKRLIGLRRIHPAPAAAQPETIIQCQPGTLADERRLHADLADYRVVICGQREWYRYCPEALEVVAVRRAA